MVKAMDHEAVEGDIDGTSEGRSNSWYKLLITKQSKVQAMDQEAEGAIDGASDGRSDRWYKRWITKQSMV